MNQHQFHPRHSLMDDLDNKSQLHSSKYLGYYNMLYILAMYYITGELFINGTSKMDNSLIMKYLRQDFLLCAMSWPIFICWSFTALLINNIGINNVLTQAFSIIVPFIYSVVIVLHRDWNFTHSIYICCICTVFAMKIHSFMENSTGPVKIKEFAQYLLMPALIYEKTYPRTETIRLPYLIKKAVFSIFLVVFAIMIIVNHIEPHLVDDMNIIEWVFKLMFPMVAVSFIVFFLIFEHILNFLAEITYFADRWFYQDWWNATTVEEFNFMWNRPIHQYLYRHVYLKTLSHKYSKQTAKIIVFATSAVLHEFILGLSLRVARPVMIMIMMTQVPVIMATKWMKNKRIGNLFFWFFLINGIPTIPVLYLKH